MANYSDRGPASAAQLRVGFIIVGGLLRPRPQVDDETPPSESAQRHATPRSLSIPSK